MSKKIIDLTFTIKDGMTTFPVSWHPRVEISTQGRIGIEKRETKKLVIGTHTGTHVDAPKHFIKNGKSIDKIDLEILNGEALVIDLSNKKNFSSVTATDLKKFIKKKYKRIILNYNWSRYINSTKFYTDHPYLTVEATKFILKSGCRILCMDTPMPDNPKNGYGCEVDSPIHKILLSKNCLILEYLNNTHQIRRKKKVELIVSPLKIQDADGAPARVFVKF